MGFMNRNSKINNAYCLFQFVQQRLLGILITVISALPVNGQSFATTILNKEGIYSNAVVLHDYDSDGDLDMVATQRNPDRLVWLENEPNLQFPPNVLVGEDIKNPVDIDIADLDNDGDDDLLVCSGSLVNEEGELVWFQKQDDGSYIKWSIDVGKDFDRADIADFNNDGNLDVVAVGFDQV